MNRSANTEVDVHELLTRRHSPYAFDPARDVSEGDLRALLEAARWTMSSYNAQPWRYIVGVRSRDPQTWERLHSVLVEGNQPWAANAPVLLLTVAVLDFEHNGKPNRAAFHDVGAASACLTVEATARGLVVHQMIGIEPEKAREEFGIEAGLEPLTALAIGYAGGPGDVDDKYAERDRKPRERKPLGELLLGGGV